MDQMIERARTIDLAIGGMTCASCVRRVEKTLGRVAGVRHVSVNLATEMAHLDASPATSPSELIAAVQRAGYSATLRTEAKPYDGRRDRLELLAAALLSAPLFAAMFLPIPGWVQLVLATPVQFWLGARFFIAGFRALRAGGGNMDLLVALGTSAAYGLSLADMLAHGPLYFESSAAVITLIRLGKYLEGGAKRDAAKTISGLAKLRPALAHVPGLGDVPLGQLKPGDVIELRPGERVPVDGVVIEGAGSLDESPITGEALPVLRAPGASLLAGSLNLDAVLRLRATATGAESFLDRMARLIEVAQGSKANVQNLADRVAAVFVPLVLGIAVLTFIGWELAGAHPATAIINAVSVMVIACPCALGLATPAAILAGTGAAARNGILLRNADAIEAAARVDMVMFDKTGTLTTGKPRLAELAVLGTLAEDEIRAIAASLSASSTHPLSAPLRQADAVPAQSVKVLPGRGVEGIVAGQRYILGSAALIEAAGGELPAPSGAFTWSYLAEADGTPLAGFAFADTIRPEAAAVVQRLREMGCEVTMLSGDRAAAAQSVGKALGIMNVVAEVLPEQKLAAIRAAQAGGKIVSMVGDGVNDAAALAAADVGIAMGAAADVAIEAASISLLRPDVRLVADALGLSRKTWAVLREGLAWAMVYNMVGIPAAAFGRLSPTIAGAAMAASSLCVLGNALRLRNWRPK